MRNIFLALSLIVLGGAESVASEICSLTVSVVGPGGNPLKKEVTVEVREATGRVESARTNKGRASLCGLGVSPVDVTVGAESYRCQVVVRNVPIQWDVAAELTVTYDFRPCSSTEAAGDHAYGIANGVFSCSALVRVFDERGMGVLGTLTVARRAPQQSDQYGRIMVSFRSDETGRSVVDAVGFKPRSINLKCLSPGSFEEIIVVLKKNE